MDVDSHVDEDAGHESTMHVSAYVARALPDVAAQLGGELLTSALLEELDATDGEIIVVHAAEPTWVSAAHVRIPVTWHVAGPSGPSTDGSATISLLVVRGGDDPITELLAAVTFPGVADRRATAALHGALDRLTEHLEAAG